MKPAPFEYMAPSSLEEILAILAEYGDEARLLAGGQSLIPVMNFRLAQPTLLVDLNRLQTLSYIKTYDSSLHLGAMVRQRQIECSMDVATVSPLLHETMPYIAHPQIRNRGTLGGSLAHADPAAELPVMAVILKARFHLQQASAERWLEAGDFFVGLFTTALEPEEMITEVAIPALLPRTGYAFMELARRHGDYAQAGVAALITLDDNDICTQARLVYLNLGEIPMVAHQAAQMLVGDKVTEASIEAAAAFASQNEIDPTGDIHATAAYKRHLARVLTVRALGQALERV